MSFRRSFVCLLLAVLLAGCSAAANIEPGNEALASYTGTRQSRSDGPYLLSPGDHIRLKAYSDDQLSNVYEINSSGIVSIPLVGDIKAAGLTTMELERRLVARMKGKLAQNPQVNVEIASYAPFYIYGEVKKAGQYPFQPGLTVGDAIATAGGLTYRANEGRVHVRHAGATAEQIVAAGAPVRIYPGDNIRVSERMF